MVLVDAAICSGCGACVDACPLGAIHLEGEVALVIQSRCDQCGACVPICPQGAIVVSEPLVPVAKPLFPQPVPQEERQQPAPLGTALAGLLPVVLKIGSSLAQRWRFSPPTPRVDRPRGGKRRRHRGGR